MSFKIDFFSEDQSNKISFGPRKLGEAGKDIIAVKLILGLLKPLDENGDYVAGDTPSGLQLKVPLDKQNWFDCSNGKGIDSIKAATFDVELQLAISQYQIQNRLLITSYLFEKYFINDILEIGSENIDNTADFEKYKLLVNDKYLELSTTLFDLEFGKIADATIAVMHGYTPGRFFTERGYVHSKTVFENFSEVLSIVPRQMIDDIEMGFYGKTTDQLISESIITGVKVGITPDDLELFKSTASSSRNWIRLGETGTSEDGNLEFLYPFEYGLISFPVQTELTSPLFRFAQALVSQPDPTSLLDIDPSYKREQARRFFEPDPFTDPDPFVIDENRIGYFYKTKYILDAKGPFPSNDAKDIKELEDLALEKVLEFFDKPLIWNIFVKHPKGKEREELINAYRIRPPFNPQHMGVLPADRFINADFESRFSNDIGILALKASISNLEDDLQILIQKKQPRENYAYPPTNFPGYDPTDARILNAQRYERYIDDLIEDKKAVIERQKLNLESYPLQNKQKDYFVLTTETNLKRFENQSIAESWRSIDSNISPLIKFIEYRTPSLRPGQEYRAYFEISRSKLNLILHESYSRPEDLEISNEQSQQNMQPQDPAACYDNDSKQTLRTYEEYRSHAIKRRREIQRQLKGEYEAYRDRQRRGLVGDGEDLGPDNRTGRIDLGFAGPFDFNAAFSSLYGLNNVMDDREYTRQVLGGLVSGTSNFLEAIGATDSDATNLQQIIDTGSMFGGSGTTAKRTTYQNNDLEITLVNLKQRIEIAAKDIRRAGQIMKRQGIELEKGSNFNAANEAQILSRFYNQFVEFLNSTKAGKKALENAMVGGERATSLEDLENLSGASLFSYVNLKINFTNVPIKSGHPAPHGPKAGKRITGIQIGILDKKRSDAENKLLYNWYTVDEFSSRRPKIYEFDATSRGRTVNYVAQISYMTSPHNTGSAKDIIVSFFDDGLQICKELGVDAEKHVSLSMIGMYTTGIKVKKQDQQGASTIFKTWKDKHFSDPMRKYADTSQKNWDASFKDTFDEDMALRSLGKLCTLEDLYDEFLDKNDLATLICSYLECIGLPGFSLKLPKLVLPPFPKIPILGWYIQMLRFIRDNIEQILTRIACSFARTIIDKLAFPFCEEQLEDFIAAGSSASPLLNQALAKAFTDTGIWGFTESNDEETAPKERAKKLFEDVAQVVTGEELCHLLDGKPLDEAGMLMVKTLASNNGFGEDLNTDESVANFFGVLGAYVPTNICDELSKVRRPLGTACAESADPLKNIRNRLQSGDSSLTPEKAREILDIAKSNLEQKKESLNALSGLTMDELLPQNLKAGNENLIVASLPDPMKNQLTAAVENIFLPAKMSFLSALNSYVPSLSIEHASRPRAGEEAYRDLSIINLECNLERLRNFAISVERSRFKMDMFETVTGGFGRLKRELLGDYNLGEFGASITPNQVANLYKVFETEKVMLGNDTNGNPIRTRDGRNYHLVHKRYKPRNKEYVVKFNLEMFKNDHSTRSFVIESELGNTLSSNSHFEEVEYEKFLELTYPDPTSDSNDEAFTSVDSVDGFVPSRESMDQNQSANDALRQGDIILLKIRDTGENRETVLRPVSVPSAYDTAAADTNFPNYSEGDLPTSTKVPGRFNEIFLPTRYKSRPAPHPDDIADSSLKLYPRIKLSRTAASDAQVDLAKPRNSFAFNCTFNILGAAEEALSSRDAPRYLTSTDETNSNGDIINEQVGTDSSYVEGWEQWQHNVSPFFEEKHMLSKENTYFVGNLENRDADFILRKLRPAVRTLLLDPNYTGVVDVSHPEISQADFLTTSPNLHWNFGFITSGVPKFFHETFLVNNQRLLEIANERVQELTSEIQSELQSITPVIAQEYLPLVRKVYQKVSNLNIWKLGNAKYVTCPSADQRQGTSPKWNWTEMLPLDLINLNFRATPYSPTHKMVEIATKNNKLDAYNIVIDQDQFLRQGIDVRVPRQESTFMSINEEDHITLNPANNKLPGRPRAFFKYCEVLPDKVVSKNKHHSKEVFPEGQDFSRREAFAQTVISWLSEDFESLGMTTLDISEQAKTMGFKTATETIFSSLLKNLSNSSLYFGDYSSALNTRISSKPYVIPGTKCLKNRYGLNESGLLSFRELFMKGAIEQIEQELTKPEFSPFNRSFGDPGPFPSAVKKIAIRAFIKACLIDGVLKGGLAFSVWGMEPVVSQPMYIDYMVKHVTGELDHYKKMKYIWGKIVEEMVPGSSNKTEALSHIVEEELAKLPALSRQIFNPGMGFKDYFNWFHLGRGSDPSGTDGDNINEPKEGRSYYSKSGLFRRLPLPMRTVEKSSSDFWDFQDYPRNRKDSEETYVFKENSSQTIFSSNFSNSDHRSRFAKQAHKSVNEFILQDYIRISGDILNPLEAGAVTTEPPSDIVGGHVDFRENTPQQMIASNGDGGLWPHINVYCGKRDREHDFHVFWFGWQMQRLITNRIAYEILRPDSRIPGENPQERASFLKDLKNTAGAASGHVFESYFAQSTGFADPDELIPNGFIGRALHNDEREATSPSPRTELADLFFLGEARNDFLGQPFRRFQSIAASNEGALSIVIANLLVSSKIVERLCRAFGVNMRYVLNNYFTGSTFWVDFFQPAELSWDQVMQSVKEGIGLSLSEYPGMPWDLDDVASWRQAREFAMSARQNKYFNNTYTDDGNEISIAPFMPNIFEYTNRPFDWVLPDSNHAHLNTTTLYHVEISRLGQFLQREPSVDYNFEGIPLNENENRFITPVRELETGLVSNLGRFQSVVVNMDEFDSILNTLASRIGPKGDLTAREHWNEIISGSKFFHGIRLNNVVMATDEELEEIKSTIGTSGTYVSMLLSKFTAPSGQVTPGVRELALREKAYNVTALNTEGDRLFGISIPVKGYEVEIDVKQCADNFSFRTRSRYYNPSREEFVVLTNSLESSLFETEEVQNLMEHIFPIRRYTALATLNATSALAGYGRMPNLLDPFKSLLGFITSIAANPDEIYGNGPSGLPFILTGLMDQAEFQKKMTDSFPGDTDDSKCFTFPDLGEEFWENFFKQLGELMLYFPSVLFRGIANKLDPMYKEMRSHYLNCDINELTWRNVGWWSPEDTLVNGLNPKGKPQGTRSGDYTNLLSVLPDFKIGKMALLVLQPQIMIKTISKLISYATTGAIPLVDLSSAFKVPCAEIDENWLPKAKYDFGKYGRYGHPISPLTVLALSTLQLPADIEKRDGNCEETETPTNPEVSEEECPDGEQ